MGPATVAAAVQYVNSPDVATRMSAVFAGSVQLLAAAGTDGCYGTKLQAALDAAGLTEVTAELRVKTLIPYPGNLFALSLERLRGPFVAIGILDEAECDAPLSDFTDPTLRVPGAPMVAAQGRKPGG